jgi:hypothetical protein
MTSFFKICIFSITIFLYSTVVSYSENNGTRFILAGHLYPIIKDEKKFNIFIKKINSYEADYVFILGDSELHDANYFKKINKLIKSKIYYSPGNQELRKSEKNYLKNVGYLNKILKLNDIKFVLINSSDNLNNIKKNLNIFLKEEFDSGPTVILTHHRIWDDTILSEKSMEHDKSFYFKEIYPLIKNKVNFIFAGNSKRQYFRDLTDQISYGKQNVNNILWLDKIGEINAYSIGMGDGQPKANFTIVDVVNNNLLVRGDYSTVHEYDVLPKKFISSDKYKLNNKYSKDTYFFINKKKLYITFISIIILILGIRFYKKTYFKNEKY